MDCGLKWKKYVLLCSVCKEYLDIGKYHRQLIYFSQLVEDISYKVTSKGTLFRRIQTQLTKKHSLLKNKFILDIIFISLLSQKYMKYIFITSSFLHIPI